MIEWEPNKNDVNLNMPVDGQVASICWNEQTKLLTMSLAYSAVYGMGERYNGLNQNDRIVKIEVEEKFCNQGDKSYCPSPFFFTDTGFSFCTLSGGTLIFDFTQKNVITVHVPSNCKFMDSAGKATCRPYPDGYRIFKQEYAAYCRKTWNWKIL